MNYLLAAQTNPEHYHKVLNQDLKRIRDYTPQYLVLALEAGHRQG